MTVLVLCEDLDTTADQVIAELTGRRVPVLRANIAWFPVHLAVEAELDGDRWVGALRTRERMVPIEELRSVWFRRTNAFRFPSGMSEPERRHAGWEARFGLGGVLTSLPVLWMNHPSREADACYKPAQLAVARRCGLPTPETIITNDPVAVLRFAERTGEIVVKTLSTPNVLEGGGATVAHTHRLSATDLADLSGVDVTAHMFQAWLDKAYEVRVMAVGRRLFAVVIDAATAAGREDWRNDLDAHRYRVVQVPEQVRGPLLAYLASFGLAYAAVDFVVDPEGRWWFLEANPGGQYGWLQAATGLPIGTAIADLLEEGLT